MQSKSLHRISAIPVMILIIRDRQACSQSATNTGKHYRSFLWLRDLCRNRRPPDLQHEVTHGLACLHFYVVSKRHARVIHLSASAERNLPCAGPVLVPCEKIHLNFHIHRKPSIIPLSGPASGCFPQNLPVHHQSFWTSAVRNVFEQEMRVPGHIWGLLLQSGLRYQPRVDSSLLSHLTSWKRMNEPAESAGSSLRASVN